MTESVGFHQGLVTLDLLPSRLIVLCKRRTNFEKVYSNTYMQSNLSQTFEIPVGDRIKTVFWFLEALET